MADDDDDDFELDQEARIEKLKRKASQLAGGEMTTMKMEEVDPDISEAFWQQVVDFESAGWTTYFKELEDAGIALPPPEEMDDETLKAKLWEMIEKLASMRVFIHATNHLSDRELYTRL